MKEASLAWTESYPAMEYRHGPISVSTSGTATWMFGAAPEGLAEQVRATGAQWVRADSTRWPTSYAQRLALARAAAQGLDPDAPRHLTRSVVLDQA
ncbi:SIS domain-containing protein OS=Streptomyces microflavus OX=1919 GN=Smic_64580 PE=4 SV=1 [Streptomyces microflavus]